jgi:hypothetical protein
MIDSMSGTRYTEDVRCATEGNGPLVTSATMSTSATMTPND